MTSYAKCDKCGREMWDNPHKCWRPQLSPFGTDLDAILKEFLAKGGKIKKGGLND